MTSVSVQLVPIADQIACIEREIGYRLRVYQRRVADGKMSQQLADRELDRMRAVIAEARMRGLSAAVFAPGIAGARGWLAEGATLVAVGVETGHLRSALLQVNAAVRAPA